MSETNSEGRTLDKIRQMESRTDWKRLRQMTNEDIERAAREDPNSPLLDEEWFRTARLVIPSGEKRRITIRLDEDVVSYFKRAGEGYQTRINEVLKAYVLSQHLKEQREALKEESSSR